MNRRQFIKTAGAGAAALLARRGWATPLKENGSMSATRNAWPILTCRGSHYEIGRQHGEQLHDRVRANVAAYVTPHTAGREDWADRLLAPGYEADEAFAPWIFDELRGIADGSGVPYRTIRHMHYRIWNALDFAPATQCTTIGMVAEDGRILVGGTCDDPTEPYHMIRYVPDDAPAYVTITWAGAGWCHNGTNAQGFSLASAGLVGAGFFRAAWQNYVGQAVVHAGTLTRALLERCHDVPDALALLKRAESLNNFVLGDARGNLAAVQCMGSVTAVQHAEDYQGLVFTTNHAFMPEILAALKERNVTPEIYDHSQTRLDTLVKARESWPRTEEGMKSLLRWRKPSAYDGINNERTAWATYAYPEEKPAVFHLAGRPVHENEFAAYEVERDYGPSRTRP